MLVGDALSIIRAAAVPSCVENEPSTERAAFFGGVGRDSIGLAGLCVGLSVGVKTGGSRVGGPELWI